MMTVEISLLEALSLVLSEVYSFHRCVSGVSETQRNSCILPLPPGWVFMEENKDIHLETRSICKAFSRSPFQLLLKPQHDYSHGNLEQWAISNYIPVFEYIKKYLLICSLICISEKIQNQKTYTQLRK